MSNNIKKIFSFLSICIIFGISGCEKDLYENTTLKKDITIIKTVNIDKLQNMPFELMKFHARLAKKAELKKLGKVMFDSINDFYIDEQYVKYMQSGEKESYTFAIKRENHNNLENLIFTKLPDGSYQTFFVIYDFTAQELKQLTNEQLKNRKVKFVPINFDPNGLIAAKDDFNSWGAWVCINQWSSSPEQYPLGYNTAPNPETYTSPSLDASFCSYTLFSEQDQGDQDTQDNSNPANNGNPQGGNGENHGSGGGGSSSGLDFITTPNTTLVDISRGDIKMQFESNLNVQQLLWWNNPANTNTVNEIVNYLFINQHHDVENDIDAFCKEAIIRMSQNHNLHIDINTSAKSPFYIDLSAVSDNSTPEKNKFNAVYNVLLQSPKFQELFVNMFGGTQTLLNIKFEIGPTIHNANGSTTISLSNPLNNTITINPTFLLNNNKMFVAKTIIHECIHAYLNVKLCNPAIGMTIPALNNMDVFNVINKQYNGFSGNNDQHNFIYNFMLPTMQTILSQIKDLLVTPADNTNITSTVIYPNNPNSTSSVPFNWNDCFSNISLLGLQDCTFFQNEIGTFNQNGTPNVIISIPKMNYFNQYRERCQTWLH